MAYRTQKQLQKLEDKRGVQYTITPLIEVHPVAMNQLIQDRLIQQSKMLNIKYKSVRVNNFSAYMIFGGAYSIDLASNAGFENNSSNPNDIVVAIKRSDYMAQIGFGTDFYLEYFKFGIELKMSYGLTNVFIQDYTDFSNPISRLNSQIFTLSFTFEG